MQDINEVLKDLKFTVSNTKEDNSFYNFDADIRSEDEIEQEKKEKAECLSRRKKAKLQQLIEQSNLHKRFQNTTFENSREVNFDQYKNNMLRCQSYAKHGKEVLEAGQNLYLYGNCGCGKTHLAACICNALLQQGFSCFFTSMLEISALVRKTYNCSILDLDEDKIMSMLKDVDFLFIDDLGTECYYKNRENTWLAEKLFEIVDSRYRDLKPIVISSNYNFNELFLQKKIPEKIIDRLNENTPVKLEFNFNSLRKQKEVKAVF